MKQPVFDEYELIASISRDSFYEFVKEFWGETVPEKPVWNWHIKYLCDELQYIAERVFKGLHKEYDLVINISPGSTKSTICSVMFPAWVWTRMQTARIIGASYSKDLAGDLSRKNRDIVKCPKYQKCFDVTLREDQDVKTYFMNTKKGYRIAVGTGGITGYHGHFIMVDDPLNPNEALSEAELLNANTWMFETLSNRKVDPNITPTILIMQRLHQNDPTAQMLERTLDIKHICLPAYLTDKVKPISLRKFYKKGLMDVVRLNKKVLTGYEKALGERGFAGQYLQTPAPVGGSLFKTDRLVLETTPPTKFQKKVRFWDKAGTAMGGAYTAGVKFGLDVNDRIWILDVVRGQWDTATRERHIKVTTILDGHDTIVGVEQEPGSGGKESAENTVRNLMGYHVIIVKPTGDKTVRAEPFSTQVNSGNVSIIKRHWTSEYIQELMFFPDSTYKDQVDASGGAFTLVSKPKLRAGAVRFGSTRRRRRIRTRGNRT